MALGEETWERRIWSFTQSERESNRTKRKKEMYPYKKIEGRAIFDFERL